MIGNEEATSEVESLYRAGIDQFMPRHASAGVLKERVQVAFRAIAQRRMRPLGGDRDVVVIDLAAGAHTARHLVGRLSAEMELARSTDSRLEIALVRVGLSGGAVTDELLGVLSAVQSSLRPRLDWMALLHPVGSSHRIAVVMPNPSPAEAVALEQHVRNAFALDASRNIPELCFGRVCFEPKGTGVPTSALALLAQAEQRLRTVRSEKGVLPAQTVKSPGAAQARTLDPGPESLIADPAV